LIKELFNYKVVYHFEGYNFDVHFVFIRVRMKNYELLGNLVKPSNPRNVGLSEFMEQVRESGGTKKS
jgi:hypothetical protein